jgi:hypothetical protein
MRALCAAAAALCASVALDAARSAGGAQVACDDGHGAINDEYCDCALDGSDEPRTAACSGLALGARFRCENEGLSPVDVPLSRVGDGVCDCCDGSDEPASSGCGASRCRAEWEAARAAREAAAVAARAGSARRRERERQAASSAATAASDGSARRAVAAELERQVLAPARRALLLEERRASALAREELLAWARAQSSRWRLERDPALVKAAAAAAEASKARAAEAAAKAPEQPQEQEQQQQQQQQQQNTAMLLPEWPASLDSDDTARLGGAVKTILALNMSLARTPDEQGDESLRVPLGRLLSSSSPAPPGSNTINRDKKMKARVVEDPKRLAKKLRRKTLFAPLFGPGGARTLALLTAEALGLLLCPVRLASEAAGATWAAAEGWIFAPLAGALLPAQASELLAAAARAARRELWMPLRNWAARNDLVAPAEAFWDAAPTLYFYLFRAGDLAAERLRRLQQLPSADAGIASAPRVAQLRRLLEHAERLAKRIARDLDEAEKTAALDTGPSPASALMSGRCFDRLLGGYRWQLCPFVQAKQGETLLGKWSGWQLGADGQHRMLFVNGQRCWNGPGRSVNVSLTCGVDDEITSVDEPSACAYVMSFATPIVCELLPE